MLESCLNPVLAAEITMQPVRRHGVDAAIFFSDIVVPLKLAGVDVEIVPGIGPVIAHPVASESDLDKVGRLSSAELLPITRAVEIVVGQLDTTPLIGFGGAPFTLASYLIEGGPSRELPKSKKMMVTQPELWSRVLTFCAEITASFIRAQVLAGASALQVFDSWAGKLTTEEYETFAAPYTKILFDELSDLVDDRGEPVPRVHFGLGSLNIVKQMHRAGATAIGVDHLTELEFVNQKLAGGVALQGNINPDVLDQPWPSVEEVRRVIESGKNAPGHVVNLGHGVPKDTDPDVLTKIVDLVRRITA
jgi:uroporphyrinogen decarboxylase